MTKHGIFRTRKGGKRAVYQIVGDDLRPIYDTNFMKTVDEIIL